jgi:Holliday junction resolvase RusA-like endonuclease
MSEVRFTAYVKPEPQGSSRAFIVKGKWGGADRAVVTSDNKDLKSFRSEVTREAIRAVVDANLPRPMAEKHVPVSVEVDFYFQRPPSIPKKRIEAVVRPDVDKCLRSILDSYTGVIFEDDAQVVSIVGRKHYGAPERVEAVAAIGTEIESAAKPEMAGTLF